MNESLFDYAIKTVREAVVHGGQSAGEAKARDWQRNLNFDAKKLLDRASGKNEE